MDTLSVLWKSSIRFVLITVIIIGANLGCSSSPVTESINITANPNPDIAISVELTTTQGRTATLSTSVTIPPPIPYSTQSINSITITPAITQSIPMRTVIPLEDIVREMIGKVSLDRALNDLKQLTGDEPLCIDNECYTVTNRLTGSEGLQWAKEYVSKELISLGYYIELRDWSRYGRSDQNLIARKPGALHPEEEIYFIAHLDGARKGEEEHFPGADDDASGVVDILEMARIMSSYTFNHTLVLLFSTGEEQGRFGTISYIDQLTPSEISSIKYAVNIDMIGYDANQDKVMELWSGDHPPSFDLAKGIREIIQTYQLGLEPVYVTGCD